MKENNLLASVALFSELYNNDKDIYDVIGEFLKEAITSNKKWIFNSTEATTLLKRTFDFEIPDAVIKTTLKNRLQKTGFVVFSNGMYTVDSKNIETESKFSKELEETKTSHTNILSDLIAYIERLENYVFTELEIETIYKNFNLYLLDGNINEKYSKLISAFIIENQNDQRFTTSLNVIKEGLLLYAGIRYTSDLNNLGSWNTDLTIFLDTEHLFNSAGYNGVIYQEIFDDFFGLVNEINNSSKNKIGHKRITLKYFEENKQEVDGFFYKAEQIVLKKINANPSKAAMISIINGCKTPSEIISKKTKFYADLNQKGISIENKIDYYKNQDFSVEGNNVFEESKKISAENGKLLDEDECRYYLKLFTKINVLRNGTSSTAFDNVGYVFMTAKSMALFLAHNVVVKFKEKDIPFATDLDFVTNKFWFKLKKGFNNKSSLPKSFDIITKAQVILSSQITNSISIEFDKLTEKYHRGEITMASAIDLSYNLRERPSKPEEITNLTLEESLNFLNDDNIEKHLKEKSILLKKVEEGELAKVELRKINTTNWIKKKKPIKLWTRIQFYFIVLMCIAMLIFLLIVIIVLFVKLIRNLTSLVDSLPDIVGLIALLVLEILPLMKLRKSYYWLSIKFRNIYKNKIQKLSKE